MTFIRKRLDTMELIAVAIITILAIVSPGPDFAMVTRNSLVYGRPAGLYAALGIAAGVQVHVLYTMLGVGLLIQSSPAWFSAIRLAGAVYLIYVGCKTFTSLLASGAGNASHGGLGALGALRTGFITNALNPKTTLFVLSVYTQVVSEQTPLSVRIGYGLFMSFAHWAWFSVVSLLFSDARLRTNVLRRQALLNRVIGSVLCGLGLWLAVAPALAAY